MSLRNLIFLLLFPVLLGFADADDFDFLEPTEENVIYGMDHGSALLLDVYRPENPNGHALIFIMGTGFTAYGSYSDLPLKQLDRWLLEMGVFPNLMGENRQMFAPAYEAGFTVFSINHRLAPKNHWEAQLRDVQRAIQFVRANALRFGVSSEWIAGMGHSSGACMITLAATAEDSVDPESIDPVFRFSSRLQAVVPVSGIFDFITAVNETPHTSTLVAGFVGRTISYQPEGHDVFKAYAAASPVNHLDPSDPPMLIIHAAGDDVVNIEQSAELARVADELSISNEFHSITNGDHSSVFDMNEFEPMPYAANWLLKQMPDE